MYTSTSTSKSTYRLDVQQQTSISLNPGRKPEAGTSGSGLHPSLSQMFWREGPLENVPSKASSSPAQPSLRVGVSRTEVEGVALMCMQNLSSPPHVLVFPSPGLRSPHESAPVSRAFLSQL